VLVSRRVCLPETTFSTLSLYMPCRAYLFSQNKRTRPGKAWRIRDTFDPEPFRQRRSYFQRGVIRNEDSEIYVQGRLLDTGSTLLGLG